MVHEISVENNDPDMKYGPAQSSIPTSMTLSLWSQTNSWIKRFSPKHDLVVLNKIVLQNTRFPFVVITLRALEASKALRVISVSRSPKTFFSHSGSIGAYCRITCIPTVDRQPSHRGKGSLRLATMWNLQPATCGKPSTMVTARDDSTHDVE